MKIVRTKKEHVNQAAKIMNQAYWNSIPKAKKEVLEKIKRKETFVAIEGKEVLGILTYMKDFSHYSNYAENLIISEKHRRKGIALELLKKYVEASKKETPEFQKYCLSSTDVGNKASIKMHEKFGFKKMGIMKKLHYGKDEIFYCYKLR